MADTPADNVTYWNPNEEITSSKLNSMVKAVLYGLKIANQSNTTANQVAGTATDANSNAIKAQRQATQATDTANEAKTAANNATTTANAAMSRINAATGGKAYASLSDANSYTGVNTFNALLKATNGMQVSGDVTLDRLMVNNPIKASLQTITPNDSKASGINNVTQIANAIDSKAGTWFLSSNIDGLPGNVKDGMLIAISSGMQNNSGAILVSGQSSADTLYIAYVTNGNLGSWYAIGNTKMEPIKPANADANNLTNTGCYAIDSVQSGRNFPDGVGSATLWVIKDDTNFVTQLLQVINNGAIYSRSLWNGRWTAWSQVITDVYLKTHEIAGGKNKKGLTSDLYGTQDMNQLIHDGTFTISGGINNGPTDPDTNQTAGGPFTIDVIANPDSTIVSQDLIQVSKGYKYVRGCNNGSWSEWLVLTPFN